MQVHVSPTIPDGDLPVRMNPGNGDPFGIIEFGDAELVIESDADAERVIKAAALSIAMRKMIGAPHQFESDAYPGARHGHCLHCGMLSKWADHDPPVITDSERTCPEYNNGEHCHRGGDHGVHRDANGDEWRTDGEPNPPHHVTADEKACTGAGWNDEDISGYVCTAQDGHDGPDHIAYNPGGGEYRRWPAAAAPAQDRHADLDPGELGGMSGAGCYDITGRTA